MNREEKPSSEAELKYRTLDTLDFVHSLEKKKYPGVGVGDELRFNEKELAGMELRYENKRIHQYVAVLNKEDLNDSSKRHRIY
jgi:hypothetical protein